MGTEQRDQMGQRAFGAMLRDAFFTWPSAFTIAFSLVMFFVGMPPFAGPLAWIWLAFGAVAELAYLWTALNDPVARQEAVARMLTEKYDPGEIRNLHARQQLRKALEYKKNIDVFVARQSGAMKEMLKQTADEINDWIGRIYQLAKGIDLFEANSIIAQDRRSVPTDLANLKRRIQSESDPSVRAELEDAIKTREQLLETLKKIEANAKRTEIKIDNTVAQLSTVYSQMQLLNSRQLDNASAQRIRDDIRDEIASLSDLVSSMDEVYQYGQTKDYAAALEGLQETAEAESEADSQQAARRSASGNS